MDAREPADHPQAAQADESAVRAADEAADDLPDDLSIDMTDELLHLLEGGNPFSTGRADEAPTPGAAHVAPPPATRLDLTAVQLDGADPTGPDFLPFERVRRPARWWARRLVLSAVVVAVAVAVGALLTAHDLAGWIVGLAVGLVGVLGAAAIWYEALS